MVELVGNMHIHTPYSDGEKWHAQIAEDAIKAGLDFIIVTDHNVWVQGIEGYYQDEHGRVLVLSGEEVHNMRRNPQGSHFLAYGTERELALCAFDPQALINETNAAGGYGFLAHPYELELPLFSESNLGWQDWHVQDFTGLEIWNYMSSFKNALARRLAGLRSKGGLWAKLRIVQVALRPEKYIDGPEPETLAKWDALLAEGKRVAAVGNSDAHGTTFRLGPIERVIYPYEFCFRAVNTHVLIPQELTGDVTQDKRMVLQAIGRGHSWVGYDMAYPTKGFRFSGQGANKGFMGDEITMDVGATLQVKTPVKARIRLICHGRVVAEVNKETNLTHIPVEAGAYRVECYLPFMDKERGWIFSNPIYLR
ncbi:MAG: CehA/McbA family metallohydrolase [Chloroflexota bacterium]